MSRSGTGSASKPPGTPTCEPALAAYVHGCILRHATLEDSLSSILAGKLESPALAAMTLRDLIGAAMAAEPAIGTAVRADLQAVVTRDPACGGYSRPLLHFKGFHAIQAYRIAHHYWLSGRLVLGYFLQSRISEVFAVDIHPGARIGKGIMFDHATSVVIGETAVVEDDFSMLHEVTLGGTGRQGGDRHPKIRRGRDDRRGRQGAGQHRRRRGGQDRRRKRGSG